MSEKKPHEFSHLAQQMIGDLLGVPFTEPARMHKRPIAHLGSAVMAQLTKLKIGSHSPEDTIREKWTQIVGTANATYSHPVTIDAKSVLLVHVSHAVVRSELNLHRSEILMKIKQLPGCDHLKRILFRAG